MYHFVQGCFMSKKPLNSSTESLLRGWSVHVKLVKEVGEVYTNGEVWLLWCGWVTLLSKKAQHAVCVGTIGFT
jgi:hypothetical protein